MFLIIYTSCFRCSYYIKRIWCFTQFENSLYIHIEIYLTEMAYLRCLYSFNKKIKKVRHFRSLLEFFFFLLHRKRYLSGRSTLQEYPQTTNCFKTYDVFRYPRQISPPPQFRTIKCPKTVTRSTRTHNNTVIMADEGIRSRLPFLERYPQIIV